VYKTNETTTTVVANKKILSRVGEDFDFELLYNFKAAFNRGYVARERSFFTVNFTYHQHVIFADDVCPDQYLVLDSITQTEEGCGNFPGINIWRHD